MTRDNFIKLQIGDLIYNKETNQVVEVSAQWPDGAIPNDNESLWSNLQSGGIGPAIRMGDFQKWEHVSDEMPDKVKIEVLINKVTKLEQFVYSRLH